MGACGCSRGFRFPAIAKQRFGIVISMKSQPEASARDFSKHRRDAKTQSLADASGWDSQNLFGTVANRLSSIDNSIMQGRGLPSGADGVGSAEKAEDRAYRQQKEKVTGQNCLETCS